MREFLRRGDLSHRARFFADFFFFPNSRSSVRRGYGSVDFTGSLRYSVAPSARFSTRNDRICEPPPPNMAAV